MEAEEGEIPNWRSIYARKMYLKHREKILVKAHEYYLRNRDKILEKSTNFYKENNQEIQCPCGSIHKSSYTNKHIHTIKHITYLNDIKTSSQSIL